MKRVILKKQAPYLTGSSSLPQGDNESVRVILYIILLQRNMIIYEWSFHLQFESHLEQVGPINT